MDPEAIREHFAPFGPVQVRHMFGGQGIYHAGVMFALEAYGDLWLKADEQSRARFEAAGSRPFVYEKNGKRSVMSYWRVPDAAMDDADAMREWAALAMEAAQRAVEATRRTAARRALTRRRQPPSDPR